MFIDGIKFLDKYVGNPACFLIGVFRSPVKLLKDEKIIGDTKKIQKILIIQLWGIGETITTLPALSEIRKKFPEAEITILATTRNRDVYYKNSNVNFVLELDTSIFPLSKFIFSHFREYDIVIDMEEYLNISAILSFFTGKKRIGFDHGTRAMIYNLKTKYNDLQHSIYTFLDLTKTLDVNKNGYNITKLENLKFSKEDELQVNKFFREKKIKLNKSNEFIVGIAPGTAESASSRKWPKERYAKLADSILNKYKKRKCKVVFIGASDERVMIDEIMIGMLNKKRVYNSAGMFILRETFCLIKKCDGFIGNDSGPMHIAAAQGVKTLGLFGPNTPVRWEPFGKGNAFVYMKNSCKYSPCINTHKGEVPNCLYSKKSEDYQKCMKAITVDNVMIAFSRIVDKK